MTRSLADELQALLTGRGLCTEFDQAKCKAENGDYFEWACQHCKSIRPEDASSRAQRIAWLRLLQAGGYPFQPDDLAVEDWQDLGQAVRIEREAEIRLLLKPWMKSDGG